MGRCGRKPVAGWSLRSAVTRPQGGAGAIPDSNFTLRFLESARQNGLSVKMSRATQSVQGIASRYLSFIDTELLRTVRHIRASINLLGAPPWTSLTPQFPLETSRPLSPQ